MLYNTIQQSTPTPHSHTLSVYTCAFSLGRGEGRERGEVREKVEGQQYTSIVPSSMGAKFTSWVENTNHE
jgi:hypothetical protein